MRIFQIAFNLKSIVIILILLEFHPIEMRRYSDDILQGLENVPLPESASSLIVTGKAQPIISIKAGETILAGSEYGNGKVLVGTNEAYISWLYDSEDVRDIEILMNNIRFWLTGQEKLKKSYITDIKYAKGSIFDFKLVTWNFEYEISDKEASILLKYLERGGGLICSGDVLSLTEKNSTKKLYDYSSYKLLKSYLGIYLRSNSLNLSNEFNLDDNRNLYSHFDEALTIFKQPNDTKEFYFNTLESALSTLFEEGVISAEKINQMRLRLLNEYSDSYHIIPSEDDPVIGDKEKDICKLLDKCLIYSNGVVAPEIESFPFDFEKGQLVTENFIIDFPFNFKTNFAEKISTGFYLPAGINIKIIATAGDLRGWRVIIGSHDDNLAESGELDDWKRWPLLVSSRRLERNMSFSSPFGGLVYFESSAPSSLNVLISNVVESPFIDFTKPETINDWNRRRLAPGPWAELAGENIIITTPSSCIIDISNHVEIIQYWDQLVASHHQLRGTNVKMFKRERIVNDIQPVVGYMHSGYPVVTELDVCQPENKTSMFNISSLKRDGNWGLFHEIGHNMQRDVWDFIGCEELLTGRDIIEMDWLLEQREDFYDFFQDPTYEKWQTKHGVAVFLFAQLIKHFGWRPMYQFFKNYEADINSNSPNLPQDNQEKIDQWVIRYSNITQKNLTPHFLMYGIPVSENVDRYVKHLPKWAIFNERDPDVFFSR